MQSPTQRTAGIQHPSSLYIGRKNTHPLHGEWFQSSALCPILPAWMMVSTQWIPWEESWNSIPGGGPAGGCCWCHGPQTWAPGKKLRAHVPASLCSGPPALVLSLRGALLPTGEGPAPENPGFFSVVPHKPRKQANNPKYMGIQSWCVRPCSAESRHPVTSFQGDKESFILKPGFHVFNLFQKKRVLITSASYHIAVYRKDAVIASSFWLTGPEWFWPTLWAALGKQRLQYPQLSAEAEPWALLRNSPEFSQGLHHEHWQQQLFVQTTVRRGFLARHTVAPAARARAVAVVRSLSRVWLWPHELQHTTLPCPSLSPGVCSNSCPLSRRCGPIISSSVPRFSSCPQSFPASGSFPMS